MVNIQLASPTLSPTTTSPATTVSNLLSVPVSVTSVPATLENLVRAIQTNAMPVGALDGNTLQLTTALGPIIVTLAQQLIAAERQNLTQQLVNLVQGGRPLTLTLQPGSPPTQGTLLVPALSPTTQTGVAPSVQAPRNDPALHSLVVGKDISAIVLPNLSKPAPAVTQAQPSPPVPMSFSDAPVPPERPVQTQAPLTNTGLQYPSKATQMLPPSEGLSQTALTEPLFITEAPARADAAPRPLPAAYARLAEQGVPFRTQAPEQPRPVSALTQPPLAAAKVADLLAPGNEVTLHVDAVLPDFSQAGAQTKMPALAPNQLFATVTGTGTGGQLILKAAETTLFVKTQVSAPIGTSVIVSVEPAKSEPLLTIPAPLPENGLSALPPLISALAQANPQVFQQVMAGHIPQPTDALPGALLFLFSAFKQGNVRDWLGNDATEKLYHAGKETLIKSLSKELNEAGQPARDPVVGEWKSYPIPLYAHQQFQALTLYVHSDRDPRKDAEGVGQQAANRIRFLIDMRLSKLGAMQVDGFVQPKKLDMILRSEATLPDGLHNELRTSYIKAMGAVGYTGSLNFQVGRQHWTVMQKAAPKGIVT